MCSVRARAYMYNYVETARGDSVYIYKAEASGYYCMRMSTCGDIEMDGLRVATSLIGFLLFHTSCCK